MSDSTRKSAQERHLHVHKTRLHVNNKQDSFLRGCAGFRRLAYNWALNACNEVWNEGGKLSPYEADKAFNAVKKEQFPWSYDYPSCVGQLAIKYDLKSAFDGFYRRIKQGGVAGYPRFKSKHRSSDSVGFSNVVVCDKHIRGAKLDLPKKQGVCRLADAPKHKGRLLSTTISRSGDRWNIALLYELEQAIPYALAVGEPVGIDVGIARVATLSSGEFYNTPERLDYLRNRRIHLQRKQSKLVGPDRKKNQKASKSWLGMKSRIADCDRKITDLRQRLAHEVSASVAASSSVVVMEDLNVSGMMRSAKGCAEKHGKNVKAKSGLNREMANVALGELRRQIEYKVARHKGSFIAVDPKYTSQTCSACGHKEKANRATQSKFKCVQCSHTENADLNAAKNILAKGLEELTGNPVRASLTSVNDGGGAEQLVRPLNPLVSAA